MEKIGEWISDIITHPENEKLLKEINSEIKDLCLLFALAK